MSKETELPVTQEMEDLWLEYQAFLGCRDQCVRSVFKTKKAIYYSRQAERARLNFWRLVRDLYPQWKGRELTYNIEEKTLSPTHPSK